MITCLVLLPVSGAGMLADIVSTTERLYADISLMCSMAPTAREAACARLAVRDACGGDAVVGAGTGCRPS